MSGKDNIAIARANALKMLGFNTGVYADLKIETDGNKKMVSGVTSKGIHVTLTSFDDGKNDRGTKVNLRSPHGGEVDMFISGSSYPMYDVRFKHDTSHSDDNVNRTATRNEMQALGDAIRTNLSYNEKGVLKRSGFNTIADQAITLSEKVRTNYLVSTFDDKHTTQERVGGVVGTQFVSVERVIANTPVSEGHAPITKSRSISVSLNREFPEIPLIVQPIDYQDVSVKLGYTGDKHTVRDPLLAARLITRIDDTVSQEQNPAGLVNEKTLGSLRDLAMTAYQESTDPTFAAKPVKDKAKGK